MSEDESPRDASAETLALLVRRERELNVLRRRIDENDRWTNATVSLASTVSGSPSAHAAVHALAVELVDRLAFERVRVRWGDVDLCYPPGEHEADELAEMDEMSRLRARARDFAPVGLLHRAVISSRYRPGEVIELFVTNTHAMIPYVDVGSLLERLHTLTSHMIHPVDALRLRLDLIAERDGLQDHVDAATDELREAVRTTEEALETAERAALVRSRFLAHMSHEIRTPMTAILGYSELLVQGRYDGQEELDRYLGVIMRGAGNLLRLLDDILDRARLDSGRVTIEPAEGSIPALLGELMSLLRVRATEKSLGLSVRFASPLPTRVRCDFDRLRQILMNLVGNALKFTEKGHVEVVAWTDGPPRPGPLTLAIEVRDTGRGIEPEALDRIFEEFETTNESLSFRGGHGTGLGLSISRQLAQLMGGDIRVDSELGVGSSFSVRIEVEVLEGSAFETRTTDEVEEREVAGPATEHFMGTVLLAEDTEVVREVVCKWLETLGVNVHSVSDGLAALEAVEAAKTPYDIIFLDMQMPRLDGYGAAQKLREAGIEAPIIALTAHAMVGERERCIAAGCTDYCAKPLTRERIRQLLGEYLRPYAPERGSTPSGSHDPILSGLMDAFYEDARDARTALARAHEEGDYDTLVARAHQLAGSAATFGFATLAAHARAVKTAFERGPEDAMLEAYRVLMRELATTLSAGASDGASR